MLKADRDVVVELPETAFEVDAIDELNLFLEGALMEAPEWLNDAMRVLLPIERQALSAKNPIGWAVESAKLRLQIAALMEDNTALTGAVYDAVNLLDMRLRSAAKAESDEEVAVQIGKIRIALRPIIAEKVERRGRQNYGAARVMR